MKHGAIALHRRLITKFVAMAVFFSLVPQAITYVLSSRSTSAMILETLRVSLEEKSFLVGADIDRFFSSASVTDYLSKPVDKDALLEVLTKVAAAVPD
jgi:hypothetical protein